MVQAVLTGRSTGSGFDLVQFSSLSSVSLVFTVLHIYYKLFVTFFTSPFSELSLAGLALDLVD